MEVIVGWNLIEENAGGYTWDRPNLSLLSEQGGHLLLSSLQMRKSRYGSFITIGSCYRLTTATLNPSPTLPLIIMESNSSTFMTVK